MKTEAEQFQKRHLGSLELFSTKEIEDRTRALFRQLKVAIRIEGEKVRQKRNIFGSILHSIADVATGKMYIACKCLGGGGGRGWFNRIKVK